MQNMLIKVLVFLVLIPSFAMAKDEQPIKIDPLSLYARTVYPEDVKTVGDAARYLLEPTGYQLVVVYPAPKDAVDIYQRKIPPIAKIHRTMPIIDALQILIGNDNWIVVDRNNKLISFSESKS
ncbi:hypothetical protein AO946_26450 [Pseudomonas aeruginosa]|uniref:hypothetical protein n=1 Tax=Pseudomonas aeruginosa TaxID=287 RepID=UPI00071B0F0E|nr:hypothetical protein [Pseudomonas aeruginosa]EKW0098629.1 hypothetical protein [Pseudomonas aeruginosa]KSG20934.1 hypothetical protein AO946_26450 [Pseudomonas aeruginosa]RQA67208.1 hypothetical protein IPC477_32890 [Pseudomonas aeruginosa]HBO5663908.1 hypothetical protein [Pseudomonas aeruginosa]HCE9891651.1 hypothetical protein [Pseudomonas aeruginosa]